MDPRSPAIAVPVPGRIDALLVRVVDYAPGEVQAPHAHDHASVTMVLRGSLREVSGRAVVRAGPLSVVAKPVGLVHADDFGAEGARTLQVTFPPSAPAGEAPRLWSWEHGGAGCRAFLRLHEALGSSPGTGEVTDAVRGVLATLVAGFDAPHERVPGWLAEVADALDARFADPPRVAQLAEELGIHPGSLARSFRRHFGTSPRERLRRRRVCAAAALLTRTRLSVAEIAARVGCSDHSHLCRTFRASVGCSPTSFRERVAS